MATGLQICISGIQFFIRVGFPRGRARIPHCGRGWAFLWRPSEKTAQPLWDRVLPGEKGCQPSSVELRPLHRHGNVRQIILSTPHFADQFPINRLKQKTFQSRRIKAIFLDGSIPIANPLDICPKSRLFTECVNAGKPEKRIFLLQNATATGSVLMQNA